VEDEETAVPEVVHGIINSNFFRLNNEVWEFVCPEAGERTTGRVVGEEDGEEKEQLDANGRWSDKA